MNLIIAYYYSVPVHRKCKMDSFISVTDRPNFFSFLFNMTCCDFVPIQSDPER